MAGALQLTVTVKNARLQAIADRINLGGSPTEPAVLRLYTGTMPVNPEDAVGIQVMLMEIQTSYPYELSIANGVLTADAMSQGVALGTGLVTWGRIVNFNGEQIFDAAVGVTGSGNAIEITSTSFLAGALVNVTSAIIVEQ